MSRKVNLEDTVLNYFTNAPLPAAELMLRIATGAIKRRQGPVIRQPEKKQKENKTITAIGG